jgi:benzoyl-CoA reductase/2-hydroxyglutaryl-CoA dehydratase subunit BcrC/BadD/HgdB
VPREENGSAMNNPVVGQVEYFCPYVPAELIRACGFEPVRLCPDSDRSDNVLRRVGLCPYARGMIANMLNRESNSPVILTTLCDQQRRIADLISLKSQRRLFLMHVPAGRRSESLLYYLSELRRLMDFLVNHGGCRPDNQTLAEWMLRFDDARGRLLDIQHKLNARRFTELSLNYCRHVEDFNAWLTGQYESESFTHQPFAGRFGSGIPLAVVGGPLLRDDLFLFDRIETEGGRVVLNGGDFGERTFPAKPDRRRIEDNPMLELADAYLGGIPHPFQRPNDLFYQWLGDQIQTRGVRGIIVSRYAWCDVWHGEVRRMKDWSPIPVLDLDGGEGFYTAQSRIQTRVQAFLEMLI